MRNCWSYAINQLEKNNGWLIVRLTKRSVAKPVKRLNWLGTILIIIGLWLVNWGFLIRQGRWLHVYHANTIKGPYTSYEPNRGVDKRHPPLDFEGTVVSKEEI